MSKLDVYLRSIERFGAAGAVLASGQTVTLKFPTGDRNATQVTPHDQLVIMIREIAPPAALDAIDNGRPARFELDSQGTRYAIGVSPRQGAWSVAIEPSDAAAAPPAAPPRAPARAQTAPIETGAEMTIERGQYDVPAASAVAPTSSGSGLLDQLTTAARAVRATDIYLSAGSVPLVRASGELAPAADRGVLDGDLLSREIGVVAPPEARAAWFAGGSATFAYGDGAGRVRVTLTRDQRGPGAVLRLLHGEAPPLAGLGLGEVARWLEGRGLVVIAGASGAGKTTTQAALVRALGEKRRAVVTIEDPIEILQTGPSISQRAVGEHVHGVAPGIAGAMREGVDAIVIGSVLSEDSAAAVVDAVAGGHLVLTIVDAPAPLAVERLIARLGAAHRELGRTVCEGALVGTIAPIVGRGGARTFEVAGRGIVP